MLKTETVHFVKSVKLVSVYVKLLKPLEPKVSDTETGFDITNTAKESDDSVEATVYHTVWLWKDIKQKEIKEEKASKIKK